MKRPGQYSAAAEHEQQERKRVTAGVGGGESRRIEGGSEERGEAGDYEGGSEEGGGRGEIQIQEGQQGSSSSSPVARATVVMSPAARLSAAMRSPATPIALVSTPNVIAIDTEMHEDEESDEEDDEDCVDVGTSLVEDGRKFRSKAWREYVPVSVDGVVIKGQCKYCNAKIGAKRGAGTSALRNHLRRCKERKEALRVVDQLNTIVMSPDGVTLRDWSFDPEVTRRELVRMIVLHELPFSIVEYDGFRKFVSSLNPLFKVVSRKTLKNDCLKAFEEQKQSLKEVINNSNSRISLTMDMWTSNQTLGYMCITAHYINDDWKLQKRIIKFSVLETPHTGVAMFNTVLKAIQEWNCENKLFAITLDNASNNGVMARLLKDNLLAKRMLLGDGRFLHQRCAAHILNLICQAGLSFINPIVHKIRESVKYIRGSQSRKERFEEIVTQLGISRVLRPCLDVPTRWNSTYQMIAAAMEFRRAFDSLGLQDPNYAYTPAFDDWERAEVLCGLLKVFYDATEAISGSKYPTSNLWFHEIWEVKLALEREGSNIDSGIHDMVTYMQKKFNKYWKLSWMALSIPVILDPQFKFVFLEFRFVQAFGSNATSKLVKVKKVFRRLFSAYAELNNDTSEFVPQGSGDVEMGAEGSHRLADWDHHLSLKARSASLVSSELETYLAKPPLPRGGHFDILNWWKMNYLEYPTLARMAKDVLAMPASTVASESAFSTGQRVVSDFRSRMTPETVEALVCLQDWLRASGTCQLKMDSIYDFIEEDDLQL